MPDHAPAAVPVAPAGRRRHTGIQCGAALKGGRVDVELFSVDGADPVVYIETYRPGPGYTTYYFGSGKPPLNATHPTVGNYYQKCFWNWPWSSGSVGSLELTCSIKY